MVAAWVAEHNNDTVGHVVLVDKLGALLVSQLFLIPGQRGSLVGDSLLWQARIGGESMLDAIEHSSKAIELYERTGWTLIDLVDSASEIRAGKASPRGRLYKRYPIRCPVRYFRDHRRREVGILHSRQERSQTIGMGYTGRFSQSAFGSRSQVSRRTANIPTPLATKPNESMRPVSMAWNCQNLSSV